MNIPDPVELMEMRMENEIDKIDADGLYPCANCDERHKPDEMECISPLGDGPLLCGTCATDYYVSRATVRTGHAPKSDGVPR